MKMIQIRFVTHNGEYTLTSKSAQNNSSPNSHLNVTSSVVVIVREDQNLVLLSFDLRMVCCLRQLCNRS